MEKDHQGVCQTEQGVWVEHAPVLARGDSAYARNAELKHPTPQACRVAIITALNAVQKW